MGVGADSIRWQRGDPLLASKLDAMSRGIESNRLAGGAISYRSGANGTSIYLEKPVPERLKVFGLAILRGSDKGKVKVKNLWVGHGDPRSTDTDWYTAADVTLTLSASTYSAVCIKYTIQSGVTAEAVTGASVAAALAAVNQEPTIARKPIAVFYRDGSSNVTLQLDLRTGWHIFGISVP